MTKNDKNALVILCLIIVVSSASLLAKDVFANIHETSTKNSKVGVTESLVNGQEETNPEAESESPTDEATIETTTPEETTTIEQTTNASTETTTTTSSNVGKTQKTKEKSQEAANKSKAPSNGTITRTALSQYNSALLADINAARASAGLDAVYIDDRLTKDALIRACECADSNTIKHYRPDGSECFSVDKGYYLAEILYRGTTTDSGIIVDAWLKSTTHRNVILDASYSHSACGIAMVQGSDGYYYCCIGFR